MTTCPRCSASLVACYPNVGVLRCSAWPKCGYLYVPRMGPWWRVGVRP